MEPAVYPASAVERARKVQEVILRAIDGRLKWYQAAEILGISDRQMRRWKQRYEQRGYDGLFDRRRQRPSPNSHRRGPSFLRGTLLRVCCQRPKTYITMGKITNHLVLRSKIGLSCITLRKDLKYLLDRAKPSEYFAVNR